MNHFPPGPEYSNWTVINFSKIRGDIRELMFISGVNDTGNIKEKILGINFIIFCSELIVISALTPKDWIFAYFTFSCVGKLILAKLFYHRFRRHRWKIYRRYRWHPTTWSKKSRLRLPFIQWIISEGDGNLSTKTAACPAFRQTFVA
jgi:hypothetical protein